MVNQDHIASTILIIQRQHVDRDAKQPELGVHCLVFISTDIDVKWKFAEKQDGEDLNKNDHCIDVFSTIYLLKKKKKQKENKKEFGS